MMRKRILIALPVLLIAIAVVLLLWDAGSLEQLPFAKKPIPSPFPTGQQPMTMTGLELAEKMLPFVQTMALSKEKYADFQQCKKGKGCKVEIDSPIKRNIMMPIAYFELYRATGNKIYKKTADDILTNEIRECTETINSDECAVFAVTLFILFKRSDNTQQYKDLTQLLAKNVDRLMAGFDPSEQIGKTLLEVSTLLDYSDLSQNTKYRDEAIRRFNAINLRYTTDPNNKVLYQNPTGYDVRRYDCDRLLRLVGTGFYWVTGDEAYRVEADQLIANAQFHQNPQKMKDEGERTLLTPCVEALMILYELTGDESYKKKAVAIMEYLIQYHMDHPTNRFFSGDYAFLQRPGIYPVNAKILNQNLWLLSNLAKMEDIIFDLSLKGHER